MIRRIHCPKCRAPIAISVTATPSVRVEEDLPRGVPAEPLPERMDRLLARSGERGQTVREMQQKLKGPTSQEIFAVLSSWMEGTTPRVTRHIRGAAEYYVLISAPLMNNAQRIEGLLAREGCASERTLYRRMHLSFTDCAKAVDSLVASGAVKITGAQPRIVHLAERCTCIKSDEVVTQNGDS